MSDQDAQVVESTAIEVVDHPPTPALFRTDDPVEVVQQASHVANALKDVMKSQGLISVISGREHPRVEAWQTCGAMLGVFPVKEWVREIPWPDPIPEALKSQKAAGRSFGFEASYLAQRADGSVLGGGEAACSRTENMWKSRDDYALRSMAQTRATSKALSAPLRFIMALAGYETTPAEEMPTEAEPVRPAEPVIERASQADVDELKAVASGLKVAAMKLAFGVAGVPVPEPFTAEVFHSVPKAKVGALAKALSEAKG